MKKIVVIGIVCAALAGCSQTAQTTASAPAAKQADCEIKLNKAPASSKCPNFKYSMRSTSQPPLISPGI